VVYILLGGTAAKKKGTGKRFDGRPALSSRHTAIYHVSRVCTILPSQLLQNAISPGSVSLFGRRGGTAAAEVDRVAAAAVVPSPVPVAALAGWQPLDHAVARQHASVH